jgi:hypothetical protein
MEGIKIQLNQITLNKTKRFLSPCLKLYGTEFIKKISSIYKLAYGIGDMYVNQEYQKHIFVLVDTERCTNFFVSFIEWIREQDYYEDDYSFDNLLVGHLHMVVIKLPDVIDFSNFLSGKYSKMYTNEEIISLLNDDEKAIVIKDKNYKFKFVKRLNELFGTNVKESEIEPIEFEIPPHIIEKEIF